MVAVEVREAATPFLGESRLWRQGRPYRGSQGWGVDNVLFGEAATSCSGGLDWRRGGWRRRDLGRGSAQGTLTGG